MELSCRRSGEVGGEVREELAVGKGGGEGVGEEGKERLRVRRGQLGLEKRRERRTGRGPVESESTGNMGRV